MSILIATLKEELETVRRLEEKFLKKLNSLPNGSFVVRKVGKSQYGYLTRREDGIVKQEYLGVLDKEEIKKHRDLVRRRRSWKEQLKSVREQKKILERALRGKTT